MNIKGGALEFDVIANNQQINRALEETKKRVKGFTDATVLGGKEVDAAFNGMADSIEKAFQEIDRMNDIHSSAIKELQKEYDRLGQAANEAFMKGTSAGDEEFRALEKKRALIQAEIKERQRLLEEIASTADALAAEEQRMNQAQKKTEENAQAQATFRTRLREVREALAEMELQGKTNTEEYRNMQTELQRLSEAMDAVTTQQNMLKRGERGWEGLISGISGVTGVLSAAQGATALLAGENENLQKIMLKVQSLMSITIGLREVQLMLDKDEAFMLVTLRKAKELYTVATEKAAIAMTKFGLTTTAANVAAKALMATLTLGFSIAITAAIVLVSKYINKTREAKKAQEEFNKEVAETASKPVASINALSSEWEKLGDNLEAKEKFVTENAEKFRDLGVKVNSVYEAENLLVNNKQAFIDSQIAKAKAIAANSLAAEKAKELLENQLKLEEAQKTPKVTRYMPGDPMTGIGVYTYEIDNPDIEKYKEKGKEIKTEIEKLYESAARSETESAEKLKDAGMQSAKEYEDGTVGAYRAAITKLQEELEHISDPEAYQAKLKEIEGLQKKINAIIGESPKTGGGTTQKDPFIEQLENRKKAYQEYYKWINSTDKIAQKAAKTEFAGILAEGSTYLEYLENMRSRILADIGTGEATKKQAEELKKLNSAITEESTATALSEFENALQTQLSGADSLIAKLDIIAQKRKELENDDSGLQKEKGEILDTEQTDIAKQAEEENRKALQAYNDYLQSKIDAELSYLKQKKALELKIEKETDSERKKILQTQLSTLETGYLQKQTVDYDGLVEEYRTYQQKCADISAEYDKKIALATKNENQALVTQLQKAKSKALSSVALNELQNSGAWEKLLGNLDDLTTKQLNQIIAKVEAQKAQLGVELDPSDLDVILSKLEAAKDEIRSRNPFSALLDSIKELRNAKDITGTLTGNSDFAATLNEKKAQYDEYLKWINSGNETLVKGASQAFADLLKDGNSYTDYLKKLKTDISSGNLKVDIDNNKALAALDALIAKEGNLDDTTDQVGPKMKKMFADVASSITLIKGAFDSVVSGLSSMGLAGDEITQDLLGDIGNMVGAAGELATGIATGNPLGIIQGSIGLISSAFEVFNIRDRKAERAIKKHAEAVQELQRVYKDLEHAVDNALGESVYDNQKALINNMRQQQAHLQQMWQEEEGKKKSDSGKINEYKDQYAELGRQIEDVIADISASITQTTAKDLANQLADALVEAYGKGEDAAKAYEEVAKNVMQNAVKNALKLQFLEKPLQSAIDQLQRDMGFDAEGNGSFDGLTAAEQQRFKDKIAAIGSNFSQAMNMYKDLFKEVEEAAEEDPTTSLAGAIKGASQESIDLLAGQTNAVRVNQVESIEIERNQLIRLASIDNKIGISNKHLESIDKKLSNNSDPLRAQGIIV